MESKKVSEGSSFSEVPARRPKRLRQMVGVVAMGLAGLLVVGEGVARFGLGLGDPPLSIADPQIEYLFKPSMSCRRFGRHISFNAYSMRSGPTTQKKTDPGEVRVLVVGDSVVYGGVQSDDSEIATALLEPRLRDVLHRPVYVGNISAGSWGPPNMLAYARRFGWFDADVVVIVLSSDDYCDVPSFRPTVGVNAAFPDRKPVLALQELVARYALPRLRKAGATAENPQTEEAKVGDIATALEAVREMVRSARGAGARVIIAQHLTVEELDGHAEPGHAAIAGVAKEMAVEVVELGPAFQRARDAGEAVYRDSIHPSSLGQRVMADVLLPRIVAAVQAGATRPTTRAVGG